MGGRVECNIGDYKFYIKTLPPLVALKLVGDLQKRIIGPAAKLIASFNAQGDNLSDDALAGGIRQLSEALDGDTFLWAFKQLVQADYVSIQLEAGEIEKLTENAISRFELPLDVLVSLAIEVAKVNFSGFFRSVGNLIGTARNPTRGN